MRSAGINRRYPNMRASVSRLFCRGKYEPWHHAVKSLPHSQTGREDKSKGESSEEGGKKKKPTLSLLCSAWHAGWHAPSTPPDNPQRAVLRAFRPDSSPFYTNTTHTHTSTKILLKRLNRLQSFQPTPDPFLTSTWARSKESNPKEKRGGVTPTTVKLMSFRHEVFSFNVAKGLTYIKAAINIHSLPSFSFSLSLKVIKPKKMRKLRRNHKKQKLLKTSENLVTTSPLTLEPPSINVK